MHGVLCQSHVHMIIGSTQDKLEDIVRDMKKHKLFITFAYICYVFLPLVGGCPTGLAGQLSSLAGLGLAELKRNTPPQEFKPITKNSELFIDLFL